MTNSKLNPASEAISMVKAAQTNEEDIPVAPLPNPGEGGPVYDGSMNNDPMDNGSGGNGAFGDDLSSVPVIPLPNPGEGGPVYKDPNKKLPTIPIRHPVNSKKNVYRTD